MILVKSSYTASTEPYFYDSAYQLVRRPYAIQIDENGKCTIVKQVKAESAWKQWQCTNAKVYITPSKQLSIVTFKQSHLSALYKRCDAPWTHDECRHTHYTNQHTA